MKKFRILIFAIILIFSMTTLIGDLDQPSFSHSVVYGELMIEVKDEKEALAVAQTYGLELLSITKRGLALFKTDNQETFDQLLEQGFSANSIYQPMAPPWARPGITNDPLSKDQFSLTLMDTPQAWDLTTGDVNITIAIIDSGIDMNHEEFAARISPLSYNSSSKLVGTQYVNDTDGHGTMVAGIIAANKDNQKGIAGIVQNSQLMVIKASSDSSDTYTDTAIIEGIYYAVENGANVINISLGGTYANPNTRNAVNYALEQGVIVVAASGNDGDDTPIYPASFKNTISVGSVNQNKVLSDFTSFGQSLDVVAPGDDVLTTFPNNQYYYAYGTSFAAPQVTGVIALMMSFNQTWTAEEIITRIKKTATDLGEFGPDYYYGYGFVNTYDALTVELVSINFNVSGGIQMPSMFVAKDRTFKVDDAMKGFHTFEGWYLDQTFDTPLIQGETTLNQDTTIYARFEAFKYTITFITNGTPIDPLIADHGTSPTLEDAEKEGHTFAGWFLDETYRLKYIDGPISENLTLHAKFIINTYTIDFVTFGEPIDSIEVMYMSLPTLPEATKEGFFFYGWYLDSDFNQPYSNTEVKQSFTLYAKFVDPIYHTVSFVSQGAVNDDIIVLSGTTFELPTIEKEQQIFIGWYQDMDLLVPYAIEPVFSDLTLYAKFSPVTYQIRFFSYDETLLETFNIPYGEVVTPTFEPSKPATKALSFTFAGWTESLENINQNLDVYPTFDFTYNPNIIRIAQGLDTIDLKDTWFDGGLNITDENISVMTRSNLDQDSEGTYYIFYDLYVFDAHIDTLIRVINVKAQVEEVIITLNPSVTTIKQGQTYFDQGATTNFGTVEVEGEVDTSTPGIYQIIYTVFYQNQTYQKSNFVHVLLQENDFDHIETSYYKEERLWWQA